MVVCYGGTMLLCLLEPDLMCLKCCIALTEESAKWRVWPEAMFGGQAWMLLLRAKSTAVLCVKHPRTLQKKCHCTFTTNGPWDMLLTDNSSVFTSLEFQEFVRHDAIHHVTISPYHTASNRLNKHTIQTFKSTMKKVAFGPIENWVTKLFFINAWHHTLQLFVCLLHCFWVESLVPY